MIRKRDSVKRGWEFSMIFSYDIPDNKTVHKYCRKQSAMGGHWIIIKLGGGSSMGHILDHHHTEWRTVLWDTYWIIIKLVGGQLYRGTHWIIITLSGGSSMGHILDHHHTEWRTVLWDTYWIIITLVGGSSIGTHTGSSSH